MKNILKNIYNDIIHLKTFIIIFIIAFISLNLLFHKICLISIITGFPCPGCGMTRAILAALHLDFSAAFAYHPLFFLMPFFLLAYYLDPWIDWSRHTLLLTFTVLLFIVVYLIRLLYLHDPMIIWHPADGVFFRPVFSLIK